jgi:TetR/AcrR family transcriptional regulator, fatty acid metabolism regulator protein
VVEQPAGTSEKARETRQRILDAAIQVFASKGYHDARVDEIVAASETSKGSVYFHFPSKERIFLALIDEFARLLERRLADAIAMEPDGVRRVNAALGICLETFGRYRSLAKIFLVQAMGLGTVFEEKQVEIHERFVQIIRRHLDQAVAEGDIAPLDTEVAANAWMGAINEVVIRWVRTGQPDPDRVLPTLRTMLLRSIGVSEQRIRLLDREPDR